MILFCPRCGAQVPEEFRGEWFVSAPTCSECGVATAEPPAMLAPSAAEVTYGLDEWPVADRAALIGALVADEILYRWEPGVVLAVPETVEAVVDGILDDLEVVDDDEEPDGAAGIGPEGDGDLTADGGEEAQAAMGDLFVAADRLQHTPSDQGLVEALVAVADVVGASLPPYGVEQSAWRRMHELAVVVGESADEDEVAESSAALRDSLRPYV